MVTYTNNKNEIETLSKKGFFVGWPNPPTDVKLGEMLSNSAHVWAAVDGDRMVGFINMITDGVFYGYIPLLEVLPEYKEQGIGGRLVSLMKETGNYLYAIDIVCDDDVRKFYEKYGFHAQNGMFIRNFENQNAGR